MSELNRPELQRLRYWQGQTLRSRDFRDQMAIEAQLWGWHNRALHNTFGVSLGGLAVLPILTNGALTAVQVTCGLAYDCFGRALILQETPEIPVPPAPQDAENSTLTLLIRYKETARFPKRHDVEEGCLYSPCSSFCEEPDFIWKPSGCVEVVDGVPLARVKYDGETVNLDKECATPISRPLARPHIASGATISRATAWETWSIPFGKEQLPLGFQVKIDTSAAGFTDVPCYFAWLQGFSSDQPQTALGLLLHFEHLDEISTSGFTFRLLNVDPELLAYVKQGLFVCWLGIQTVSDLGKEAHLSEVNHVNS